MPARIKELLKELRSVRNGIWIHLMSWLGTNDDMDKKSAQFRAIKARNKKNPNATHYVTQEAFNEEMDKSLAKSNPHRR